MRIIVAGGRKFDDYNILCKELDSFLENVEDKSHVEFVSGRAIGTDRLGERYAEEHGYPCTTFEAEWFKLGRRAGIVRNAQMAKYASMDPYKEGILFAFWNGSSKGTKNMIDQAEAIGLDVHIINYAEVDNE